MLASELTGQDLRRWMQESSLDRKTLAAHLRITPRTLQNYESRGEVRIPAATARHFLRIREGLARGQSLGQIAPLVQAPSPFCWPSGEVFDTVWKSAQRRADSLELLATLTASPDHSHLADCRFRLTFRNLEIGSKPFHYDHLAAKWEFDSKLDADYEDSDDPEGDLPPLKRNWKVLSADRAEHGWVMIRRYPVEIVDAFAYEIYATESRTESVQVFLRSASPVPIDSQQFIGVPLYPDLAVKNITVRLRLRGLAFPLLTRSGNSPGEVTAKAYTIRRSYLREEESLSTPLGVSEIINEEVFDGNNVPGIKLGPIERPMGGYFYAISWPSLERVGS